MAIRNFKASVIFIFISILFVGCANLNYRPPVKSSAKPNIQKSYFYGRFSLEHDFMNKVRLALQIENKSNGKIQSLKLLDDQKVYAVEVEPGTYQLKGFIYALLGAVMDFETTKIVLPTHPSFLKDPINAAPGVACYLGDYYGSSRRTNVLVTTSFVSVTFQAGILGIEQNFSNTTNELKRALPQFQHIIFKPAWTELNKELQKN
jgi:hypothetical protein